MSRKQKRAVAKSGPVWHQSAEEATLARMPKYNAHACGTGAHGDAKYNRARQKRAWQKELNNEGPRNRGGLPLLRSNKLMRITIAMVCLLHFQMVKLSHICMHPRQTRKWHHYWREMSIRVIGAFSIAT